MKKIHTVKDKATEDNFNEVFFNLRITDVSPLGEDDYWWTAYPLSTDKEKPFIRPCKVSGVRRLYFFDLASEDWHYLQMT